ncbi:MAG TPA: BatB protein, partial [Gammaproteobacteria bacterium]|nr:BatB protein [Gammaproteobacteria bacterium]
MSYQFLWPWMALALPLPLLMRRILTRAEARGGGVLFVPFAEREPEDARLLGGRAARWRKLIAALIWLLLVLAAMGPQRLDEPVELPRKGRNLMLAVDVSGSMQTPDM